MWVCSGPTSEWFIFLNAYGFKEIYPLFSVWRQTPNGNIYRRRCVRLANVRKLMNGAVLTMAILLAIMVMVVSFAMYAIRGMRKECYALKCRVAEKRKIIDILKVKNGELQGTLSQYREFVWSDSCSLVAENHARSPYRVDVNIWGDGGRFKKTIKSFSYDPCDVEDEMFAIREANELIEIIQKA